MKKEANALLNDILICTTFYRLYHTDNEKTKSCLRLRKEGNVLFNDALNTFYLRLYGVGHMVKDHSDSVRGNPLLFPISNKGSF